MNNIETTGVKAVVTRTTTDEMSFNVIVTFNMTPKVMRAIDDVQLMFDLNIKVTEAMTYDDVMRSVVEKVTQTVRRYYKLGKRDMWKISTCGNWKVWERLTGLDADDYFDSSDYARDGKVYL